MVSMKKLFLILFFFSLTLTATALDIQKGSYKLIEGDEELCESGTVRMMEGDLKIGNRLTLVQMNKPTFTYEDDDKTCSYLVKNTPQSHGLKQEIEAKCKEGTSTRSIFLTYLPPKLSYTIVSDILKKKKINCSLELVK